MNIGILGSSWIAESFINDSRNIDDVNIVSKVIKRGSYWAIGPEIEEFENRLFVKEEQGRLFEFDIYGSLVNIYEVDGKRN